MGKVTLLSVKTIFTRKTQMEGEAYMGGLRLLVRRPMKGSWVVVEGRKQWAHLVRLTGLFRFILPASDLFASGAV